MANTAGAEAANPTTGVHPRDDAPAGAEPQAAAATSEAGPPAQPPPADVHSPRLALSSAEDEAAERPAPALSAAAAPADSEHSATAPSSVPAAAWAQLDAVDLQTEFAIRLPTMQGVPAFLRPGIRQAYTFSLRALRDAHSRAGEAQQTRAWKLFLLVPRLLLFRVRVTGSTGREALLQRVRGFLAGRWTALLAAARDAADHLGPAPTAHADDDAASLRRREAACAHVRRGEVSRGRTVLTAAALAPGTEDNFAALSDPARRPPALLTEIPADVRDLQPDAPATLTDAAVGQALRSSCSSRRGTAAVLSGATCEHYKVLLDAEALELFAHAANLLASAQIPVNIAAALAVSRLTALRKPAGGVRGIATGDTFRRLVSRCLARQYADTFDEAARPYQFALQTRAGTDALSGMLRAAIDLDADATIVSLDGRSAYDTISRAAFLRKLREVAPALVPFVRLWYGQESTYYWWDASGARRSIRQGEGCGQGDGLGPGPVRAWPTRCPRCCRRAPATG